jgi:hypothetical protein
MQTHSYVSFYALQLFGVGSGLRGEGFGRVARRW